MWHEKNIYEVIREKKTNEKIGLTTKEVENRKKESGLNQIRETKKESIIKKFIKQFNDCFG